MENLAESLDPEPAQNFNNTTSMHQSEQMCSEQAFEAEADCNSSEQRLKVEHDRSEQRSSELQCNTEMKHSVSEQYRKLESECQERFDEQQSQQKYSKLRVEPDQAEKCSELQQQQPSKHSLVERQEQQVQQPLLPAKDPLLPAKDQLSPAHGCHQDQQHVVVEEQELQQYQQQIEGQQPQQQLEQIEGQQPEQQLEQQLEQQEPLQAQLQDNAQNQLSSQPLSEKTPISTLQEMCTKQGVTPQYDLVANEGAVHEPLFVFKVTAGEYISTGKGPSKKKAKHNAAVACLQHMLGAAGAATALGTACPTSSFSVSASASSVDECMTGNPVGELQEITQKRMWPPPVYDFASEQGPPHAREFICIVRLFDIVDKGLGKSKKLAKRNAAVTMLQLIKQGLINPKSCVPGTQLDDYDNEDSSGLNDGAGVPTNGGVGGGGVVGGTDMRGGSSNGVMIERKKVSAMFQTSSKTSKSRGKLIESLQAVTLEDGEVRDERKGGKDQKEVGDDESFCRSLLENIAKEQKFETNYIDLNAKALDSTALSPEAHKCLCMLRLTTVPVTMSHGAGADKSHAQEVAARNALNYLKVLTRKS